jgi:cytochrome P450
MNRQIYLAMARFPAFCFFPALSMRRRWAQYKTLRERQSKVLLPLIHSYRGTPCYAGSLLELRVPEEGGRPLTDAEMVSLCSEFMVGAMDASVAMMEWTMGELVNHPDAQAKVYEEVRGKPELNEDDLRGMQYLRAVVLESLRLHPGAHLILPHAVQSDAEIAGYRVPKGAVINFLVADFGLDETAWTAAREFRPERFLDGDGDLDMTGSGEVKMAPFGAGRRICPGYMLALLHAEYLVGALVRDFQWLPPAPGEDITVDMTEEPGTFIVMKHRLRARIIPRTC